VAKRTVNKSAAMRAVYADTPKMPVRIAVEELRKDGFKVAPSQVYFVLGGATGKRSGRSAGQPSPTARAATRPG
jgi:hypothetical protein